MVEDVVAWLPHSPMLAFDILLSYGGGIGILPWLLISFMRSPSFVLGYGG
jgi:ABC-type xylose transport system permease subunit